MTVSRTSVVASERCPGAELIFASDIEIADEVVEDVCPADTKDRVERLDNSREPGDIARSCEGRLLPDPEPPVRLVFAVHSHNGLVSWPARSDRFPICSRTSPRWPQRPPHWEPVIRQGPRRGRGFAPAADCFTGATRTLQTLPDRREPYAKAHHSTPSIK